MATPQLVHSLAASKKYTVVARQNGVALTGVFTDSDAVASRIFAGEGQPVLVTPTTAWIVAADGTIKVSILKSQLDAAGVTPGTYTLQVIVTPASDSQPRLVVERQIEFTGTSGTDAAPLFYATWRDMLIYTAEISKLKDKDNDLAAFARQREDAYEETNRRILAAYRPAYGRTRRFYNAAMTGTGSMGPHFLTAADQASSTYDPPTKAQIETHLAAGRLLPDNAVREFNARWAAALVYGGQPGRDNAYAQMAQVERALAEAAWRKAVIDIDTDDDDVAELRIDRDVTWLV